MKFKVVRICGSAANTVLPEERITFDLKRSGKVLEDQGYSVVDHQVLLVANREGIEVSVYRTGRMVIHPAEKETAQEMAERFYATLVRSG